MAKNTEVWKGVIVMDNLMQKIKKKLALLLILVLFFNNTSILNLFVYAQGDGDITVSGNDTTSGGDLPGDGSVSDGNSTDGSVSDGNSTGDGSVSDGDSTDDGPISGGGTVSGGDSIVLKFNDGLDNLWKQEEQKYYLVYGSALTLDCSVSIQEDETQDTEGTVEAGHITYTVTDVLDADGNEVDAEESQIASISGDGMLTFCDGMVGTIEVKASMDEMENYAPVEVTCQIVVAYENVLGLSLVLKNQNGDSIEDKEAYNHTVYVCPPEGYQISESNSFLNDVWSENIEISQEGKNEKTFYLRNTKTNGITEGIEKIVCIDMQIPELTEVEFSQWYVAERVNDDGSSLENKEYLFDDYTLTIDDGKNVKLYYNEDVDMVFTVRGEENEVNAITFKVHTKYNKTEKKLTWTQDEYDSTLWTATHDITVDAVGLYYVTLEYKDEAGNELKYRSEYICIPKTETLVNVEYSEWQYAEDIEEGKEIPRYTAGSRSDVKLYYNGSMTMTLRDDNWYRSWTDLSLFKKNNYTNEYYWKKIVWDDGKYKHTISDEGEYGINIFAENEWQTSNYSLETIVIDLTDPVIECTHEGSLVSAVDANGNPVNVDSQYEYGIPNNTLYYEDGVKIAFEITETNFNPDTVVFRDSYYEADEMPTVDWNRVSGTDVWIAEYDISEDKEGIHQITIECTDKAGRKDEYQSEQIVLDSNSAEWAEEGVVYTEWLTDKEVIGKPDYSIPDNYVAGTETNVELYYNQDMTITFRIAKKYLAEEYITVEDSYPGKGKVNLVWEKEDTEDSDIWKATYTIPETEVGEHVVSLVYKRINSNEPDIDWKSEKINIIDTTLPKFESVDYSGWTRVEDAQGEVLQGIGNGDINETMHVFAKGEVTLNYLFTEANEGDMQKLKVYDMFNGDSNEPLPIEWSNLENSPKEWCTKIKISNQGEHVIVIKYQKDNGDEEEIVSSATIYIDSTEIQLNSVKYSVSSGEPDVIIPKGEFLEGDGVTRYYSEGVTVEFVLDEQFFYEADLTITDSYYKDSEDTLSYSVDSKDGKTYLVCAILEDAEGTHELILDYKDKIYEKRIFYKTTIVVDTTAPEKVDILYPGAKEINSKIYYKEDATISFVMIEKNFQPERITLLDVYTSNSHDRTDEYTQADEVEGQERLVYVQDSANTDKWIVHYTIPKEECGIHNVTLTYNEPCQDGEIVFDAEPIILDSCAPEFSTPPVISGWKSAENVNTKEILDEYEAGKDSDNVRLYYNDDMTVTFKIREDYFNESGVIIIDNYKGIDNSVILTWQQGTGAESNIWTATHTIQKDEIGEHRLSFKCADLLGNEGEPYTSEYIVIDVAKPELIDVSFSDWKQAVVSDTLAHIPEYIVRQSEDDDLYDGVNLYYDGSMAMTMTFVIKEANFNEDDVIIKDNEVELPYTLKWQPGTGENSNVWTATHTILEDEEGEHVITIQYNDRSGNEMIKYTSEKIIIDTNVPQVSLGYREDLPATTVVGDVSYYGDNQVVKICIKEDNFRASDVEITVNTEDALTEVDVDVINTNLKNPSKWTETADGYVAYIDLDIDAKYDIAVDYTDLAMLASETKSASLVVDNVKPVAVEMDAEVAYNTALCKRMVDNNNATVTTVDADTRFIYQDAMTFKFVMEEVNFNAEDVEVSVFRDDVQLVNGDGYQYKYDVHWSTEEENPYIHTLSLEIGKKDGELVDGDYQIKINYKDLAGHDMKPYISNVITIDHTAPVIDVYYDNQDVNNEIFYNNERVATITVMDRNVVPGEIEVDVTAKDIDGNALAYDIDAKQSSWIAGKEPYTWVSTITYDIDANYEFAMVCKDMATNEDDDADSFTVDKTAPDKESFRFVYSTPILNGIETDSNNAFYKDKVTVKIVAEDIISPIDYFEWTYIKQPGTSSINQELETHIIYNGDKGFTYDATKRTATAEFTLTAEEAKQYRGNLRFKATDMAGNTSEEFTDTERIVIVDTIAPTRTVEYSPADQIVNRDTLSTLTGFDYSSESMGVALLYNTPMTMTFKVNEANFYANDIVVKVNNTVRSITNWSKAGDVWTGSISITEDGEYIVTMQYTDRSTNEMVDYTSHMIIVDTVKPQIQVSYEPNDIKQEVEGIKYYDKQITAIITIIEHNFRAEDVEAIVKATDISGNSIEVMDYAAYLKNRNNWEKQGDRHIAKITFEKDANYEFDIDYIDLALQPADDYVNAVFTVDQTAPTNVAVSYSAPVLEKTLQGSVYEFYREPITVTITAEDEVSGVYGFDYSYIRKDGVSSVNAESVTNKIEAQKIEYSKDKKTATATFVIPASELRSGTQLNGNMEFVVNNRSMLTTEYKDPRRFVVDNIAPNVTVEFSDCVQKTNNISYYAGDIDVTITVDEANFYAEDVVVSISKDGGAPYAADVSWRTESVDGHIGSITLEDEGNYKVYVSYQDTSANKMEDYQSNLLIIDKTQPEVIVSGIKHNSANKQEQIGFVVKVEDLNLNTDSFSPKLIAEIREESGNIRQVDCTELGTIETVVTGKSCTYTVTNINQDGIYHLSCLVSDMSGNTTETMVIEDSKKQIREQLDYSVNRNGSTYGLEENTKKLINRFVKEARDVVIYETNPDEISNIKITLFKNDKTIVLEEGKDYIVNLISEDGEWYKYEYIIFATNFMEDGTYRISIYSEDKAGNIAENNLDVKNVEISFGVDKTLPNLIVTNLESQTTYPVDKLSVLMRATDNMKLSNITVVLDGKIVATWDEEQIQQMSSNLQDFVFDIMGNETKAHTVIITLTDIAGNQLVETISDFYVTTNLWVRFINNKMLFYGSIIACLTTGFLLVLLGKRRKKRNEANG